MTFMRQLVMKTLRILGLAVAAGLCMAAEPTWNPADAVKEAEQDIHAGHIKFYWAGSIASRPVGVPFEVAKNYPKANAGIGCVTTTYHFESDRKNTPAGTTRRFTPTSLRSIRAHFSTVIPIPRPREKNL